MRTPPKKEPLPENTASTGERTECSPPFAAITEGASPAGRLVGKKQDSVTILFLIVFSAFAAVNIIPWCENHAPADLISMYSAGSMVQQGQNPYNDDSLKSTWASICDEQHCTPEERKQLPGLPNALLYPPDTLFLYSLLAFVPWKYLTATLRSILILLLFAIILMVWKQKKPRNRLDLLLITLTCAGLNGTPWLIVSINTSVLIYFFLMLSYRSFKKGDDILAGIFLGVMSLKVTLMIPVLAFVCIRKKWHIAAVALITAAVPFILLWCTDAAFSFELFSSWLQATREWDRLLHAIRPGGELWHGHDVWEWNMMLDYLTTLGPLVSFYSRSILGNGAYVAAKSVTLLAVVLMSAVLFLIGRKRRIPDEHLLLMLSCIELLANYHHQYDTIVPLLFFLMIRHTIPRKLLFVLVAALSPYFIPFNGLFLRLGIPKYIYLWLFSMSIPLMVLFTGIAVICARPVSSPFRGVCRPGETA